MENDKKKVQATNEIPANVVEDKKTGVVQQAVSKDLTEELVMTPRQLADAAAEILKEAFWTDYNFLKKDGFRIYHIARKDIVIQLTWQPLVSTEGKTVLSEGKVRVNVNPNGSLSIRLNSDQGDLVRELKNVSNKELLEELPGLKAFINQWTEMPPTSKFVPEKNTSDYTASDVEELLEGYEKRAVYSNPTWSEVDVSMIQQKIDKESTHEVREKLNKTPKLTKEYYRIPSLSEEEKQNMKLWESIEWWVKEKLIGYIDNKEYDMIVIKKKIDGTMDDAYVTECIDGMPEKLKWIQLFNRAAAGNLNLGEQLPTHQDIWRMIGNRMSPDSDVAYKYNNNLIKKFIKENNLLNVGFYRAKSKPEQIGGNDLCDVDGSRYYLLSGESRTIEINIGDDRIQWYSGLDKNHAYPIMLIKK